MEEMIYLGIDAGSVGIKFILLKNKEIIKTIYLRNQGLIETLKIGLENILEDNIKGVGCTGSGRSFVGLLVGADIIKTEILAHCIGTLNFYPEARTILDIGGEDSKIMEVKNGVLENFVMNQICGAGTGSVIDAISSRMGIKIEDVGDIALNYKQKLDFPGKCGIFTQSSVVSRLNSGANKSDILMGIMNALVNNYIMLGKSIDLKPPYIFQGATSQNKALVKALEEQLDHKVIVPEYAPYMGAIGIALMVQKENPKETKFKGYNFREHNYKTKSKIAKGCENQCEITQIFGGEDLIAHIGNRCDKCGLVHKISLHL